MTAKRSDIHRPSAPEFDPEAYECHGVFDMATGALDYQGPGPAKVVSDLVDRGFRFTSVHDSQHCGHCGTRIRYAALMVHESTKGLIYVGETCLSNRFESMTKSRFDALRKATMLNRERRTKQTRIDLLLANNPALAYLSYAHNIEVAGGVQVWFARDDFEGTEYATEEEARATLPAHQADDFWAVGAGYKRGTTWAEQTRVHKHTDTLNDMWNRIERYAEISDKAAAYALKILGWLDEAEQRRVEREAATQALVATGVEVPTGRIVIEGEVVSTKVQSSTYGDTLKMLVQNEAGWKVWGSVPSAIDVDKGTRVRFTATVEQSKDDALFGFFKRPVKAEVL